MQPKYRIVILSELSWPRYVLGSLFDVLAYYVTFLFQILYTNLFCVIYALLECTVQSFFVCLSFIYYYYYHCHQLFSHLLFVFFACLIAVVNMGLLGSRSAEYFLSIKYVPFVDAQCRTV